MKLAEALQERSDINIRISELMQRIRLNAIVQEGEKPAEDPNDLMKEYNSSADRLRELIARINLTNCQTVSDGKSITELIAEKDTLSMKIKAYRELVLCASQTAARARATEIKLLSTVDVHKLQKKVDTIAQELRLLDNKIQQLNWTTELL